MKNVITIILLFSIIINIEASHFFKINLENKNSVNQSIIVSNEYNENSGSVDPLDTVNDNSPEDIDIWANYLRDNVSPYTGGQRYDSSHPVTEGGEGEEFSSFSSNVSFQQECGEEGCESEGGEGSGEGEGECGEEGCTPNRFSIEEIKEYMRSTGLVFDMYNSGREEMPNVTGLNSVIYKFELNNSDISQLSGLDNITHITNGLYFFGNNLSSMESLSNLRETSKITIMFSPVTDMNFLRNLEKGDIEILGTTLTNIDKINPNLECNEITMSDANLSNINYPNLKNIFNNGCKSLNFDNNNLTEVDVLDGITELEYLNLEGNNLSNINGLSSLVRINEGLVLGENINLSDLSPLSNLITVGHFDLNETRITTMSGLENLTTTGHFGLYEHDYIQNLNGLENLNETGTFSIVRPAVLNNIDGLQNLTRVNGRLTLESVNIPNFMALSNLEYVEMNVNLSSPIATSLDGLDNLREVGCGISVYMDNLRDISALDNLESMGCKLYINYNYNMSGGKLKSDHFICQDIKNKVYFGYNVVPSDNSANIVKGRLCNT